MKASKTHSIIDARQVRPLQMGAEDVAGFASLEGIGINVRNLAVREVLEAHGFDANDVGIAPIPVGGSNTTPSIAAQIQFLQAWLPGFVRTITIARKIDELIGISTVGSWEDEEVVQGVLEPVGLAVPYTDHGNIPLSSWNLNFDRRTIVRFEQGLSVGKLEEARTARMRVSTSAEKRAAAAIALDIQRNRVGFYGYNGGANRTYGFLNDPNLPAYVPVAAGAGVGAPTEWAGKTFLEITRDIRGWMAALRTQSGDTIDPKKTPITIALPTNAIDYLSVTSEFGNSVAGWIAESYPRLRIESAPELNDANGGESVAYIYAESVDDGSTDDNRTFVQAVPAKFMALGVEKRAKTYVEDYTNATAGVMVKRPYAVFRATGV